MHSTDCFKGIVEKLFSRRSSQSCNFTEFHAFAKKFLPRNNRSKIIHVAGTNGKGSVCALLESTYHTAGYKTGLFTSPHLIDVRERVRVNGQLIPRDDFCRIFSEMEKWHQNLSFYQCMTLIALVYFCECAVDVMILECGIGGRLDSTNIVRADAGIVTSVSLDHEELLGDSIECIAREKAGIIKPGTRVFIGDVPEAAEAVLAQAAKKTKSQLIKVSGEDPHLKSNLRGDFQKKNTKLAYAALKNLGDILPISDDAIEWGFASTLWPARNQIIFLKNGNKVVLDGAHNAEAAKAQMDYIGRTVAKESTSLIFNSTKPRHCEICLATLEPFFHRIFVTNISDGIKKIPDELLIRLSGKYASKCRFVAIESLAEYLTQQTDETHFVTGSLLLIGELANLLIGRGMLDEDCFYPSQQLPWGKFSYLRKKSQGID